MTIENRKERNNKITNEIMSGTTPTILRCPSDSVHLDFLPELFNNFKTSIVVNKLWETEDIAVCLIDKINIPKTDTEKYISCYRNNPKRYQNMLLSKVCSYLLEEKNDCLLFLCGLEKAQKEERATLEYLIELLPTNVKLVLCSETFLEINYSFSEHRFPRLIPGEITEQEIPYSYSLPAVLTNDQLNLLKKLCPYEFIWEKYAETVYPESTELLHSVRNHYRSVLLQTGDVYCFHPELLRQLDSENNTKSQEKYLRFCIKNGKAESVFYFAFLLNKNDLILEILKSLLKEGKTEWALQKIKQYLPLLSSDNELKNHLSEGCQGRFDAPFSVYPFSKIKYLISLQNGIENDEPTDEWRKCPPSDFVGWSDILARLNHQQKVKLGNENFFLRKCFQVKQSEEEKNNPLYLEWLIQVANIFAKTGKYMQACIFLREVADLYPLYRFDSLQMITLFCGMSSADFEKNRKSLSEREDNSVFPFLHALFTGDNKNAVSFLHDFTDTSSDIYQVAETVALFALFKACTGGIDYARSLSLLYLEKCKITAPESAYPLYAVLAFCAWAEGNKSLAVQYASLNRLEKGKNLFSFLSEGIVISRLAEEDKSQEIVKYAEYLLKTARENVYDNIIIIFQRCFASLLQIAEEQQIMPEYVAELRRILATKKKEETEGSLQVRFFGNSAIYIDKKEIRWKTRRCKELFLLYQLFPEGLERTWLIENIWHGYVYNSALNNLKTSNNLIRKVLTAQGIPFEFSYFNGKYRLLAKRAESDFDMYRQFLRSATTTDNKKRTIELNRIYGLCEDGFVADSDLPFFVQERNKIREEIALRIVVLIKNLMANKDYIGAKRMVIRLEKLQYPDWEKLKNEIDKKVLES